jgi:putative ABC transport system permease protein
MILNAFKFAFRNIRKNKLLASINVLGLTIGISACMVIFLIASYELSFDRFHSDGNRIYRIYTRFTGVFTGINRGVATGFTSGVRDNFAGVESVANFHTFSHKVFVPDGKSEPKEFESGTVGIFSGPEYFDVFSFNTWLIGDPKSSLTEPSKVVLTESRARTYFGNIPLADMIGREIIYRDSIQTTVSGILQDFKENSDFNFTEYISIATNDKLGERNIFEPDDWGNTSSSSQLFVKLSEGATAESIRAQMGKLGVIYKEKNKDSDWNVEPALQPLSEIHFDTEVGIFDNSRSVSDRSTFQILIVIAILLLVIAVINFVNLETAQASRRAKEVGVRKVLGSSRSVLVSHFMIESFILTFMAVICSMLLSWGSLLYFTDFIPPGVRLDLSNPIVISFLGCCLFGVSILAGIYPAFVLSSYQPAVALKNQAYVNSGASRSAFIRKSLTVFQFSFSQVLIVATVAIGMQIHFMLNKDLGFKTDAVITFYAPWQEDPQKRAVLKNELDQITAIDLLSMHSSPPSAPGYSSSTMEFDNGKEILTHSVFHKGGDESYLDLYGIELLAGRNILAGDTATEYIINETYMRELGFKNPHEVLGKTVDNDKVIVGVVKDFHTQSLHSVIKPVVIRSDPQGHFCFGLKLNTSGTDVEALKEKIALVENAWKKVYPDHRFNYSFVDDMIKRFYETEEKTGRLARTATAIAILISCLGLFGLSSFTVIQRTKEIGIRKVLGASVNSILMLLSKDFLKLVALAFVISAPLAYYALEWWLTKFAYKMDITVWLFVVAGMASILTAFFTISFRTVRAAKSDPVKSLRYE